VSKFTDSLLLIKYKELIFFAESLELEFFYGPPKSFFRRLNKLKQKARMMSHKIENKKYTTPAGPGEKGGGE
jgi:hypothetical protein